MRFLDFSRSEFCNSATYKNILHSSQNSKFAYSTLGTGVNILGYTSTEYTAPSDGYVKAGCGATSGAFVTIYMNSEPLIRANGVSGAQMSLEALFVRKGAKLKVAYDGLTGVTHSATYYPLQ